MVILEYHSSEVTISQSTAALKMSTSLFPDKTAGNGTKNKEYSRNNNTMGVALIVFLCVCVHVPAMFFILFTVPHLGLFDDD